MKELLSEHYLSFVFGAGDPEMMSESELRNLIVEYQNQLIDIDDDAEADALQNTINELTDIYNRRFIDTGSSKEPFVTQNL